MAGEIVGRAGKRLVPLASVRSGALSANEPYLLDPTNDGRFRDSLHDGFAAVQVTSPIAATPANLTILAHGQTYFLAGGGNTQTILGPVWSVQATPDATVAGAGADNITFTPIGRR